MTIILHSVLLLQGNTPNQVIVAFTKHKSALYKQLQNRVKYYNYTKPQKETKNDKGKKGKKGSSKPVSESVTPTPLMTPDIDTCVADESIIIIEPEIFPHVSFCMITAFSP